MILSIVMSNANLFITFCICIFLNFTLKIHFWPRIERKKSAFVFNLQLILRKIAWICVWVYEITNFEIKTILFFLFLLTNHCFWKKNLIATFFWKLIKHTEKIVNYKSFANWEASKVLYDLYVCTSALRWTNIQSKSQANLYNDLLICFMVKH